MTHDFQSPECQVTVCQCKTNTGIAIIRIMITVYVMILRMLRTSPPGL